MLQLLCLELKVNCRSLDPLKRIIIITKNLRDIFNCIKAIVIILIGGEGIECHSLISLEGPLVDLLLDIGKLEVKSVYLLIDLDGLLLHLLSQWHVWLVQGAPEHSCLTSLGKKVVKLILNGCQLINHQVLLPLNIV